MKRALQKGFTLMEIMIVVAILGLLAGVVVMNVGGAREQAKKNTSISSMAAIDSAMEMFKLDWGVYPGGNDGTFQQREEWALIVESLTTNDARGKLLDLLKVWDQPHYGDITEQADIEAHANKFTGPYLKAGKGKLQDGWGNPFKYETKPLTAGGYGYALWTRGPKGEFIFSEGSSPELVESFTQSGNN